MNNLRDLANGVNTGTQKANAISRLVYRQIDKTCSTERLFFAIWQRALFDVAQENVKEAEYGDINSAIDYLVVRKMPHLAVIGISPEWVMRLIDEAGLDVYENQEI